MKNVSLTQYITIGLLCFSGSALAAVEDDPLLFMLRADQLEVRDADEGTVRAWEGSAWLGKDLNKLWFKTEGERLNGEIENAEYQLLYSRAIDANWDIQFGLKHDANPKPTRDWRISGFYSLAPYFFEVDSALFFNEDGQVNLRFETEYEFVLTQKLILSPDIEVNLFSKDDTELGVASGFSDFEAGIRLRYEFTREFAPYIGINYERLLGDTADSAEAANASTSETTAVVGVRFWF